MLPFLVYVEHRKSEYKWEMYMWMLWKRIGKKEFLEYRYVFLWDSFSLLKILENEAEKNNCWKDRIYCNRFVLAEPVSKKKLFSMLFLIGNSNNYFFLIPIMYRACFCSQVGWHFACPVFLFSFFIQLFGVSL